MAVPQRWTTDTRDHRREHGPPTRPGLRGPGRALLRSTAPRIWRCCRNSGCSGPDRCWSARSAHARGTPARAGPRRRVPAHDQVDLWAAAGRGYSPGGDLIRSNCRGPGDADHGPIGAAGPPQGARTRSRTGLVHGRRAPSRGRPSRRPRRTAVVPTRPAHPARAPGPRTRPAHPARAPGPRTRKGPARRRRTAPWTPRFTRDEQARAGHGAPTGAIPDDLDLVRARPARTDPR
jgi:hypothetical protein